MKFLNEIDGAHVLKQDANNRLVTDTEKTTWNNKLPISDGTLENYREKLVTVSEMDGSINLSLGNVFQHTPSGNITYSITNAVNGQAHSFTLIITQGATARTLTFPASVKWQGGVIPPMKVSKTYVINGLSVDGGVNWYCTWGEF